MEKVYESLLDNQISFVEGSLEMYVFEGNSTQRLELIKNGVIYSKMGGCGEGADCL